MKDDIEAPWQNVLDPSNPQWPYSDGFATAKIDSD